MKYQFIVVYIKHGMSQDDTKYDKIMSNLIVSDKIYINTDNSSQFDWFLSMVK